MTKRNEISDEVRDDAAVLCAAMADWWGGWSPDHIFSPRSAWYGTLAALIADAAHDAVNDVAAVGLSVGYREAEALLRDGWCPGDKIKRVKRRKVSP